MSETIKAIETSYKGYRFRSRLEARWAVFFDAIGVDWEYEPQGFEFPGEAGLVERYLPDFKITGNLFVEVKGSEDQFNQDRCRMENAIRAGLGTLLILGEIPNPESGWGIHLHACATTENNVIEWVHFFFEDGGWDYAEHSELINAILGESWSPSNKSYFVKTRLAYRQVIDAYRAARSARFEHGESPVTVGEPVNTIIQRLKNQSISPEEANGLLRRLQYGDAK